MPTDPIPSDVEQLLAEADNITALGLTNDCVLTAEFTGDTGSTLWIGRQVHTCEEEGTTRVVLVDGNGFSPAEARRIAEAIVRSADLLESNS